MPRLTVLAGLALAPLPDHVNQFEKSLLHIQQSLCAAGQSLHCLPALYVVHPQFRCQGFSLFCGNPSVFQIALVGNEHKGDRGGVLHSLCVFKERLTLSKALAIRKLLPLGQ